MLPPSIINFSQRQLQLQRHQHDAPSNNIKLHTKILDREMKSSLSSSSFPSKTSTSDDSCKNDEMATTTTLPDDFIPGKFDVICSQGRKAKTHYAGNIYFQSIIEKSATKYANAIGKRGKSIIVGEIISTIQANCDGGGFVKKVTTDDNDGHRWENVQNDTAREKVSQSLRDVLGAGQYRSSLVYKKRRRKESNLKRVFDFDEIVKSNQFVSTMISQLANTIKTCSSSNNNLLLDDQLLQLMSQTNTNILRQLKQDQTVRQKVQRQQQQQKHQRISSCHIDDDDTTTTSTTTMTSLKRQKRQIVHSDSDKESSSLSSSL